MTDTGQPDQAESRLVVNGRDRYVITTVPGMGLACITSGVDFYEVRWGARYVNAPSDQDTAAPVVNGKTYAMLEATITHDGTRYQRGWSDVRRPRILGHRSHPRRSEEDPGRR